MLRGIVAVEVSKRRSSKARRLSSDSASAAVSCGKRAICSLSKVNVFSASSSALMRQLAMSAAVIARTDDGRWRPNYSHVLGTFAAGALSNLYYPRASRGVSLTLVNGAVEVAGNAGTNLIREFVLKGITKHAGGQP